MPAGSCLIAPRVLADVDELVEVEELGALTLKGFTRPVAALNILGLRSEA
jgi:class 3 adenylate cyclase